MNVYLLMQPRIIPAPSVAELLVAVESSALGNFEHIESRIQH